MFDFRTPWHVLGHINIFHKCSIYRQNDHLHVFNFWKMSVWPNIVINHARGL